MKYIIAVAIALTLLASNLNSNTTIVAAPEQCLDIYTSTWGGCAAINGGLPESTSSGGVGGSKGLYLMLRVTI